MVILQDGQNVFLVRNAKYNVIITKSMQQLHNISKCKYKRRNYIKRRPRFPQGFVLYNYGACIYYKYITELVCFYNYNLGFSIPFLTFKYSRITFTVPYTPSLPLLRQRSYPFASPQSLLV